METQGCVQNTQSSFQRLSVTFYVHFHVFPHPRTIRFIRRCQNAACYNDMDIGQSRNMK